MSLREELVALFEKYKYDPGIATPIKHDFRTFINRNFKTQIPAQNYRQIPQASEMTAPKAAKQVSDLPKTNRWDGSPHPSSNQNSFQKKTVSDIAPPVRKSVIENPVQDSAIEEAFSLSPTEKNYLTEIDGMTEKEIDAQILKLSGKGMHKKAPLEAKKKRLAELMNEPASE